jgi:hypothetical protein
MSNREGTGPEASMSIQYQVERSKTPPDSPFKQAHPSRKGRQDPSPWNVLWAIILGMSMIPLGMALMAMTGLGIIRELPNWAISSSSLLLIILPTMGIAALFKNRLLGFSVALWIWPTSLFLGLPLYFPGERGDAMVSGAAWLASVGGSNLEQRAAQSARRFADSLGEGTVLGTRPPDEAEVVQAFVHPIFKDDGSDPMGEQVFLPYEGSDRERKVAVTLEGANGQTEDVWMLFDTGATLTTVHPDVLRRLGALPDSSNPVMSFQTANGTRKDSVALLNRVWMAGLGVEGVSVASCVQCATDGTVGLLGLNVSGQFQVTLDPSRRVIILVPNEAVPDRQIDVSPWVDLDGNFRSWADGRIDLDVQVENESDRAIQELRLSVQCGDEEFGADLGGILPKSGRSERIALPRFTDCVDGQISLASARW